MVCKALQPILPLVTGNITCKHVGWVAGYSNRAVISFCLFVSILCSFHFSVRMLTEQKGAPCNSWDIPCRLLAAEDILPFLLKLDVSISKLDVSVSKAKRCLPTSSGHWRTTVEQSKVCYTIKCVVQDKQCHSKCTLEEFCCMHQDVLPKLNQTLWCDLIIIITIITIIYTYALPSYQARVCATQVNVTCTSASHWLKLMTCCDRCSKVGTDNAYSLLVDVLLTVCEHNPALVHLS